MGYHDIRYQINKDWEYKGVQNGCNVYYNWYKNEYEYVPLEYDNSRVPNENFQDMKYR